MNFQMTLKNGSKAFFSSKEEANADLIKSQARFDRRVANGEQPRNPRPELVSITETPDNFSI